MLTAFVIGSGAAAEPNSLWEQCVMTRFPTFALAISAALLLSAPAFAGIVSTGAGVTVVTAPTGTLSEANATYESNTSFFVWDEGTQVLGGSVTTDWSGTGAVSSTSQLGAFSVGAAGHEVTSYYMRFDKVGSAAGSVTINAASNAVITFDHTIIGVMTADATLAATDGTFAPAGLTYGDTVGSPNFRGFDINGAGTSDRFSISADGRTLTIVFSQLNNQGVDALRILINPEPGTLALFGLGVLGLAGAVSRRRRKVAVSA
jgi:hypothetical protein